MVKIARESVVLVSDRMTHPVFTIPSGTSIIEATTLLAARRVGGAPVVGPNGRPLGVVTRADLLDPRHVGSTEPVDTAMTRVLFAVRPTDTLLSAVSLMVKENIHRVLVVEPGGLLAGIVTSMDIMRALVPEGDAAEPIEFVEMSRSRG